MGCLVMIILFLLMLPFMSKLGFYGGGFTFVGSVFLVIYLVIKIPIYLEDKRLNSEDTPEHEKEMIRKIRMEDFRVNQRKDSAIQSIRNTKYEGGHDEYSTPTKGDIYLYSMEIEFYKEYTNQLLFQIPINQIKSVRHELSEDISAGKFLVYGIGALVFKDKTYYMIIEYFSTSGVDNQVIFEVGYKKRQEFVNELNVLRNRAGSRINNRATTELEDNSSVESIKQLAELRDKGILTEEEFTDKKRQILNRM